MSTASSRLLPGRAGLKPLVLERRVVGGGDHRGDRAGLPLSDAGARDRPAAAVDRPRHAACVARRRVHRARSAARGARARRPRADVLDRRRANGRGHPRVLGRGCRRSIRSSAPRSSGSARFLARAPRDDAAVARRAGRGRAVGAAEDRPPVSRARTRRTRSGCCAGCRWPPRISSPSGSRPICCRRRSPRAASSASAQGPWSAGTGAALLLNAAVDPAPGGSSVTVKGGPGALTTAMADAATRGGRRDPHRRGGRRVLVRDGRAAGVVLDDGRRSARARSSRTPIRSARSSSSSIPIELDPELSRAHAQLSLPGHAREGESRAQRAAGVHAASPTRPI